MTKSILHVPQRSARLIPRERQRETLVEGKTYHRDKPSDKLEVLQVIWINVRRWIYLQAVIAFVGVLEQAVHRIQDLVAQQEKPFPEKLNALSQYATFVMRMH